MRLSVGNNGEDRTVSNNDSGLVCKDAESLFRTKPISDIRNVESQTQARIKSKKEELRQLVGNRYRDLIDSADSIVSMKSSCHSISSNISAIHLAIHSLSSETPKLRSSNPSRAKLYGIACRVKYLVDTPENIWGCLDEYMFLEAAARYIRAKHVQQSLSVIDNADKDAKILPNFPLLQHQLLIVESFKAQISQRSRERLLVSDLGIGSYVDALAAVAAIDELDPKQVLGLFLDSRKSWILQKLGTCFGHFDYSAVISVFCEVLRIIQVSIGQVGELFLLVLSDMPLYYKIILSSPPASQLFGGIPNPDEEVRLWKVFRERLESATIMLDRGLIAKTCSGWLRNCALEIVNKIHGKYLIDVISSGEELALTEKSIRETMDSKEVLEGSLEWLKSVFGSEIELPWSRIRELVLEDDADLWDVIFEDAFVQRMRMIIDLQFETLSLDVHVSDSVHAVKNPCEGGADFLTYLNRSSAEGGVWFTNANIKKANSGLCSKPLPEENDFCSCLNAYFGPEVSRIQDAADSRCRSVLEDLLCFLESPKAAWRLKDLAPYLQLKCHECMSTILRELKDELDHLYVAMDAGNKDDKSVPVSLIVERSLFIGRLLFAFENHTKHVPLILGSPRLWAEECITRFNNLSTIWGHFKTHIEPPIFDSPGRQRLSISKRQTSLAASALRAGNDSSSPKLKELQIITQNLCIKAYNLWILWICDELSVILSRDLRQDDGLTATTSSRGWEETLVKQGESDEGTTEMKISLPSTPSLYITSFLFRACGEIHRVGGHVLNKSILQQLALRLSEKAIDIFEEFLFSKEAPQVSEKGVLQLLLDIKFAVDVLSGGDANMNADTSKIPAVKHTFRRKQDHNQSKSVTRDRANVLIKRLSQRLDPIDWLTYEPYIWENEKQTYLRHAVLFGFFVQLNRMHTDTVQKLTTNAESNIMRCSTVPRFKYLPISAPALSSRGTAKASTVSADDIFSTSPWKVYTNEEFSRKFDLNDGSNFGVAAPFLKSFMQVGSRFGESTLKLSSMLTDGQVAKLKEKSAASMFGDILPVQAAGLLSSFTAARSDS